MKRHGDDVTIYMNLPEHRSCLSVDDMSDSTEGGAMSKGTPEKAFCAEIGPVKSEAYAHAGGPR